MRHLSLVLALMLASCGCGTEDGTRGIYVHTSPVLIDGVYAGYTTGHCDGTATIYIHEGQPDWVNVLLHELWHAVGHYGDHNHPGCFSSSPSSPYAVYPCAIELEQMRSETATFTIHADPDILDASTEAAELWNGWVGREMFVVSE